MGGVIADVLVIVPGVGPLALSRDAFHEARRRGQELLVGLDVQAPATPTAVAPALLNAKQLEERTAIPATWWMAQAREHRVPHHKIGRRVRFEYAAVMVSEAVRKRAAV